VFGPDRAAGELANPAGDLAALYEAIGGLLRRASSREPIVVVVEDLHAASPDSLKGVTALVEQRIPRTLFLLTWRLGERGSEVIDELSDIARSTGPIRTLSLKELSESDVVQLTEARLTGAPPGDRTKLGRAVHRRTSGHPFLAASLLEWIARDDDAIARGELDRASVPDDVKGHTRWRLARLSPRAREALTVASVIGDEFRVDVLAGVLARPLDDLLPSVVEAEEAGLVAASGGRLGRTRFRHELTRDAIYWDIPALERARLHRAVALALDAPGDPEVVAVYAHHCYEAAGVYPEMRPRFVDASVAAARDSIVRMAYGDAADHYRRALDNAGADDERARLVAGLGDALWRLGDLSGARRELERAIPMARGLGLVELLAEMANTLAAVAYQSNTSDPDLRRLYEQVEALLPEDEVFWRVRLLTAIGRETSPLLAPQVLPDIAQRTLELAAQDDDPATRAYGYFVQHDALLSELDTANRVRVTALMAAAAETAEDPHLLCASHGHRLYAALERLDPDGVRAAIDACDEVAERFKYPYARWQAALYRAGCALVQRPLAEAQTAIETARRGGERLGYGEVELMYLVQFAFLYRELGRIEETESIVRSGAENYDLLAWKAGYACGLCEAQDRSRHDEATAILEDFERLGLDRIPRDGTYPLTLSFLAQAYAYRRDARAASVLLPVVEACRRRHPVAAGSGTYWGSMDYHLGLLHAALGQHDAALSCFETACALDTRMDASLWISHTQVAQAQTLRARGRSGDRRRAARLVGRARDTARRFGYERIEQELAGTRPSHVTVSGDTEDTLT
jgi:tetratricopeptide (TPR) repeat protein